MGSSSDKDSKEEYKKEQIIIGSTEIIPRRKNKQIDDQLEKAICRIKIYFEEKNEMKIKLGTGFLCKIPYPDEFSLLPVLITNNHIIDEKVYNENKEIEISFNDEKITKKLKTDSQRKFYTNDNYDITIIQIFPKNDDLHYFLEINLENDNILFKDQNLNVYILHYPKINESSVSYGSIKNIFNEYEIMHTCNTEEGSSGAPILLLDSLKIIGIHKGCPKNDKTINLGTLIKYPLLDFNNNKKEINNEINNEIIIHIKIGEKDLNKDIHILNNERSEEKISLKELNKVNTIMFVNNEKEEFEKSKKFKKIGIYEIKFIIKINITDTKYMFSFCDNIIDINMSKFDTKNVTSMERMFNSCRDLKSIDLSSFNTEKVTNMSCMFNSCFNLQSLDLSSFDTKNVTRMEGMFNACFILKSLDLSMFDTKNVTRMDNMFSLCYELESIDLSSFDTKNVTRMDNMFRSSNLKSIDLSKFDTKKVNNMRSMFRRNKNLETIDLSSFDIKNVTYMRGMFYGCNNLKIIGLSNLNENIFDDD